MADNEDEKPSEIKSQEEELEEFFANDEQKSDDVKAMTKEDVIAIVRDELKTFWSGVVVGKYPLPRDSQVEEPVEQEKSEEKAEEEKEEIPEDGERSLQGIPQEGIVIPIILKPIVAEVSEEKPAEPKEVEAPKEIIEQKSTEEIKTETKDNTTDEQATQVTELQKTIDGMKKEIEDLRAEPQKTENEQSTKKEPYRSDFVVEGGKITRI